MEGPGWKLRTFPEKAPIPGRSRQKEGPGKKPPIIVPESDSKILPICRRNLSKMNPGVKIAWI